MRCLITGGSSGIGLEMAKYLSSLGHEVVLVSKDENKLLKVSESINNLSSLKGEFVIVVDGCHDKVDFSNLSILEHINIYIEDGYSNMEAIKLVAKERNVPKSVIYNEYNKNK